MQWLTRLFTGRSSIWAIICILVLCLPVAYISFLGFALFWDLFNFPFSPPYAFIPIEAVVGALLTVTLSFTIIASADLASKSTPISEVKTENRVFWHSLKQSAQNNHLIKIGLFLFGWVFSIITLLLSTYLSAVLLDSVVTAWDFIFLGIPVLVLISSYLGGIFMSLSFKVPENKSRTE